MHPRLVYQGTVRSRPLNHLVRSGTFSLRRFLGIYIIIDVYFDRKHSTRNILESYTVRITITAAYKRYELKPGNLDIRIVVVWWMEQNRLS